MPIVIYPHPRTHLTHLSDMLFCTHTPHIDMSLTQPHFPQLRHGETPIEDKNEKNGPMRKVEFQSPEKNEKELRTKMKNRPFPRTPPTLKFPPVCNSCPNNSGRPRKHSAFRTPKYLCGTESRYKRKPKGHSHSPEKEKGG